MHKREFLVEGVRRQRVHIESRSCIFLWLVLLDFFFSSSLKFDSIIKHYEGRKRLGDSK